MTNRTLQKSQNALADPEQQLAYLDGGAFLEGELPTFKQTLRNHHIPDLKTSALDILQINLGYMCNQVCKHCHVDAGPDRKEIMSLETVDHCIDAIERLKPKTLDLTGGAPEMNPHFKHLVSKAKKLGVQDIIVRSNLTVLDSNPTYRAYLEFFVEHQLHTVSSLPHYTLKATDRQRGEGVFDKSIKVLKRLNELGYGTDPRLKLDLVYNPSGAFLPTDQTLLEKSFKAQLKQRFGIQFNHLFCITNLPISRFLDYLIASENYLQYMQSLVEAFNPKTLEGLMCKNTLSVGWDGSLYHCDFNQMLQKPLSFGAYHISNISSETYENQPIFVHQHCYGCTAGAGSSCQGSISS